MRILVVGANGFIGSELLKQAVGRFGSQAVGTTRRHNYGLLYYDLLLSNPADLPACDVAFLCAAVADYRKCEGSAEAWRVNVDGTIAAAKRLMKAGSFVVYLSSVAAEWAGHSAYGRSKIVVETVLQSIGDPAIVRFERVTPARREAVCEILLGIGAGKAAGIHHVAP